ncbi:acyl carrier protein [Limnoglobus roseus]|uniref:Uncharacterized protein n=1 Tax=Limnoglobus roseus TaxID=2598579 RepID=A0A5C1AP97_9BACT|nr:hypothetical protein [Limnoglobus roseus]QEL19572.1 hypothetical protein PX52LOC_06648 [Limnoglobus roseus]
MFLVDDSLLDFIVWLELTLHLEDCFGMRIPDDDVYEWRSMADIVTTGCRRSTEGNVAVPSPDDVWGQVVGWVSQEFGVVASDLTPATLINELNLKRRNAYVPPNGGEKDGGLSRGDS